MASFSSGFLISRGRLCDGVVTVPRPSFFGETAVQGDSVDRLYILSHFNTIECTSIYRDYLVSSASAGAGGDNDLAS